MTDKNELPDGTLSKSTVKRVTALAAAAPAASGVDTSTNEAWAARAQEKIEAMEAATGGEDDMCPNCVTPWKCNGPHESTGGASVSERARDDRFTAMLIGIIADVQDALGFTDEDKECSNGSLEIVAAIRELKEQALTQQRGHGEAVDRDAWAEALELPEGYTVEEFLPGGWHYAWTRADGERMVSGTTWNHPALAAIAAWKYAPDTTPQPSADAVREDSARLDWIESQIREYGDGYTEPREAGWGIQWQQERPDHYWPGLRAWIDEERRRASGDELESLLSAASGEGVGGG